MYIYIYTSVFLCIYMHRVKRIVIAVLKWSRRGSYPKLYLTKNYHLNLSLEIGRGFGCRRKSKGTYRGVLESDMIFERK